MTVLVCLGSTPDTWWQAKNTIGRTLLEKAAGLAPNEAARHEIMVGSNVHSLFLYEMESPLREEVWLAVEHAATELATIRTVEVQRWPTRWVDHVADLAHEMKARRADPGRPGAWP